MPISTDISPLMQRARVLRLKADHIARYTGVTSTTLSRAQNYGQYVDLVDFRRIESFINTAEELTRRAGAALDWKDFPAIDRLLKVYKEEQLNPPSPPTSADWELLAHLNNPDMTLVSIAEQRGIALSDLSLQMAEATRRFDHAANRLAKRNADIQNLSDETLRYADDQLAKRSLQQS
jgi:hypothetical protein